ncbi:hypothetical protein P12x_002882 [Tundrisphaera lichenicola]|uniref:hypothetical protein n=1 Tax=Tundrisphaera lichenicola TaxID=2029860 RepID=UPI003EBF9943
MGKARITIRRLMIVVAVIAIVLGLAVQIPRLKRRWDYCQERAMIHGSLELSNQISARGESERLIRTDFIVKTLEAMGPEPRDLDSIIEATGDPERTMFLLGRPNHRQFIYGYEADTGARDYSEDMPISPPAAAQFITKMMLPSRRNSRANRITWAEYHRLHKEEYLEAAWRPWLPIPPESPY